MKSPRKPKADKTTKAHNLIDLSLKESFLVHATAFERATAKVKAANKILAEVKKTAKTDGFTVPQIKFALQCQTPEGEAIAKSLIASNLLAAAYMDADIGTQFTLFLEPDRTPAVDRAYKEGQSMAMKNEAAVPKYDPSTPQHAAFMKGYHEEQERQIKTGIGKLEAKKPVKAAKGKRGRPKGSGKKANGGAEKAPERVLIKAADKAAKAAARAPKQDTAPPRRPTVEPVTRASLAAQKAEAKVEAESYFTRQTKTDGTA